MAQVFQILSDKIHPLALGNVYRQYQLIRTMSKRLLSTHLDPEKDAAKIEKIVDLLTERLYYHGYQISRHEAKEMIGLPVSYPDAALEVGLSDLLSSYVVDIPLTDITLQGNFVADGGVMESTGISHSFVFEGVASQTKDGIELKLQKSSWRII